MGNPNPNPGLRLVGRVEDPVNGTQHRVFAPENVDQLSAISQGSVYSLNRQTEEERLLPPPSPNRLMRTLGRAAAQFALGLAVVYGGAVGVYGALTPGDLSYDVRTDLPRDLHAGTIGILSNAGSAIEVIAGLVSGDK